MWLWEVCGMDIRELTAQVEHISQIYASRVRITRDDNWQILKLQEEAGELTQAHLMRQGARLAPRGSAVSRWMRAFVRRSRTC